MNDTTLMSVSEKLRTIDIKIEQINAQSILHRETVNISAIQLGNDF